MTKIFLILVLGVMYFTSSATLKIVVTDIQVGKGNIVVELYNNDKDFMKRPVKAQTLKASAGSMDFLFEIPDGIYAVMIYQDLNENKELDRRIIGIPKEPYGLSNNFTPHFGPPKFDDCKFNLDQQATLTIKLH
jgi:uncharacterized protein (DUF2141 family)